MPYTMSSTRNPVGNIDRLVINLTYQGKGVDPHPKLAENIRDEINRNFVNKFIIFPDNKLDKIRPHRLTFTTQKGGIPALYQSLIDDKILSIFRKYDVYVGELQNKAGLESKVIYTPRASEFPRSFMKEEQKKHVSKKKEGYLSGDTLASRNERFDGMLKKEKYINSLILQGKLLYLTHKLMKNNDDPIVSFYLNMSAKNLEAARTLFCQAGFPEKILAFEKHYKAVSKDPSRAPVKRM